MSANTMGRRFERLLFFAGPLAFASLLVMFVALATDQQEERKRAACLRTFAEAVSQYEGDLESARQGRRVVIRGNVTTEYWLALRLAIIPAEVRSPGCEAYFPVLSPNSKPVLTPKTLIENAKREATALEARPLSLYGIEVPEKATLTVFGTPIKMDLSTLVRVLQIALAPMLLLWLSSLYHTRHRESLLIGRMGDIGLLYPHLVNVYPVVLKGDAAWDPPKRRSWSRFVWLNFVVPGIFALIRVFLLSSFIGPPIAFYLVSVYLLRNDPNSTVFWVMGACVAVFGVATYACEFLPWHIKERFRVSVSETI